MAAAAFRTRPSGDVGGIPAEFPSQIGRGGAQVFGEDDLNRLIQGGQQQRAQEKQRKAARQAKLEKDLELAKPNILPRDEKRYGEMNTDYYNDKLENVNNLNDPEIRARLKAKKQALMDFGVKSANLHKEVLKRSVATSEGEWDNLKNFEELMDPTYTGTEEDYLGQYVGNQKLLGDIKEKPLPFDLDRDFRLNVMGPLKAAAEKGQNSMTLRDGSVSTTKWEELTKEEARAIASMRLEHPPVDKEAQARFDTLPPETQDEFEDYKDYYITQRTTPFIQRSEFHKQTKADQPRGYTYGGNRAYSRKWNLVDTVQTPDKYDWGELSPFLPKDVVNALTKKQATEEKVKGERKIHTVRIQNIGTEAENKPISIQVDKEGARVFAFPIAWRYEEGKEDEAKLIIGQKVGTGADAEWLIDEVSEELSRGDIDAATGMTLALFNERTAGTRGEQTEGPEYSNQKKIRNKDGQIINIGVKDGKWFNVDTGKIYK